MSYLTLTKEYRTDDDESRVEAALRREFGRSIPENFQAAALPHQSTVVPKDHRETLEPVACDGAVPRTDIVALANSRRRRLSAALAAYDEFLFIASKLCNLAGREKFDLIFNDATRPDQNEEGGKCSSLP